MTDAAPSSVYLVVDEKGAILEASASAEQCHARCLELKRQIALHALLVERGAVADVISGMPESILRGWVAAALGVTKEAVEKHAEELQAPSVVCKTFT